MPAPPGLPQQSRSVPQTGPGAPGLAQTLQVRNFKGINQTDARQAIEDTEFEWLENAMTIGSGAVTILPSRGPIMGGFASPVAQMFGVILQSTPRLIVLCDDGALHAVDAPAGGQTQIAAPGTFQKTARMTVWRDSNLLIIDPVAGYFQWDGISPSVVVIDAGKTGSDVAVFEDRAWLVRATRTIEYTAPTTFNDFNPANGAGSFIITDSVFQGRIVRILSALEQLWIVGANAIDAISNVQTASGITTFSVTNLVSNVGTIYPSSITSFFRTFVFATTYGVYAIVGATPQKLSDKLDRIWPRFGVTVPSIPDIPAAVCTINEVFTWIALVGYNDPASVPAGIRSLMICFAQGRWFFASTGNIRWLTSVLVDGTPLMFGAETTSIGGSDIFQLFSPTSVENADYLIRTKLYDFGLATQMKELLRVGFEFESEAAFFPQVFVESENRIVEVPFLSSNILVFVGVGPISFIGSGPITWISGGTLIPRRSVSMIGNYFGLTLTGSDRPWRLSAFQMQVKGAGDWN